MKRFNLSLYINLTIVLTAIGNFFLLAKLLDSKPSTSEIQTLANSYEEIYPTRIFTESETGRTAHYIFIEIDTYESFTHLAYAICPPSASPLTGMTPSEASRIAGLSTPEALLEASQQFAVDFSRCPYPRLMEVGIEAKKYLQALFFEGNFRVFSRGDMVQDRYQVVFILVEQENEEGRTEERYLHEILLEKGLAYPFEMNDPGPLGETAEELYQRALEAHEVARNARVGAFKHELDDPYFEPPATRERKINEDASRGQTGFDESLPWHQAQEQQQKRAREIQKRRDSIEQEQAAIALLTEEIDRNPSEEYLQDELKQRLERIEFLENKLQDLLDEQKRRARQNAPELMDTPNSGAPEPSTQDDSAAPADPDPTSLMSIPLPSETSEPSQPASP